MLSRDPRSGTTPLPFPRGPKIEKIKIGFPPPPCFVGESSLLVLLYFILMLSYLLALACSTQRVVASACAFASTFKCGRASARCCLRDQWRQRDPSLQLERMKRIQDRPPGLKLSSEIEIWMSLFYLQLRSFCLRFVFFTYGWGGG